jgi:hypothetical protein
MDVSICENGYDDRVFINCPFDDAYLPLFHAATFATYFCGFYPTTSLAEDNGLESRIDKIARIIEQCRYGIHDISRTELNPSGCPRFNMPFELGLFFGARLYGNTGQKTKNALILERSQYSYQQLISDINGIDVKAHEDDPFRIIRHIRNWLSINSKRKAIPGADLICASYLNFSKRLPNLSSSVGFTNIKELPFKDFRGIIEEWLIETSDRTEFPNRLPFTISEIP